MTELKLERPLVFIDVETTGLNTSNDRIVELTALKLHPDGAKEEKSVRINPGVPISSGAMKVHGITNDDVADEPLFRQYAKGLIAFLDGADLGGFGAIRFDLPMLVAEFRRAGLEFDLDGRNVARIRWGRIRRRLNYWNVMFEISLLSVKRVYNLARTITESHLAG